MKKVLEILGLINGGGVASMIFNYLSHMDLSEMEIHILVFNSDLVTDKNLDDQFKDLGCVVHYIEHRNRGYIGHFRTYRQLLEKEKFDIIHCHLGLWSAPYLRIAKLENVKGRIGHAHGAASEYSFAKTVIVEAMRPLLISSASHRLACGEKAGKYVWGIHEFEIINNAIDLEKYKYDDNQRKIYRANLKLNGYAIGFVGRLCKPKNLPFIINIIKETKKKYKNEIQFLIIGDGEDRENFEELIAKEKIGDITHILGQRKDISELMSAMDCLILPSLYEGFPVVAVEAQAAGLRVLLSDRVSREVKILESVEFLPIDKGAGEWVNSIGNNKKLDRNNCIESLRKAGYDIAVEARKLQEKYLEI